MGSYYSILKFVNNSLSGEYLAIGLVAISGNDVFFRTSNQKLSLAHKLNPNAQNLLKFSVKKINNFICNDIKDQSSNLVKFEKALSIELLNRLSIYNNGIVQFSKPSMINMKLDQNTFDRFFNDLIDENDIVLKKKNKVSEFKSKISKDLYAPLKEKINVDYKLKKKALPSLYFDFHFDSIGYNGALYASKAIDFNNQQVASIRHELSNYESIIQRLKPFAEKKGIRGNHSFYVISDPYKGDSASYMDIYDMLDDKDNMPYFKLINSNNISEIVNVINKTNASKFSDLLED